MRIIGGKLKGHRFAPPKGFPSRPTTDFAKEGLFNILENELDFSNLEVLDLFSGTGNITFEFVSRGVKSIISVDSNLRCVRFVRQFAKEYNYNQMMTAVKADALKFIENNTKTYDVIFADPPYDLNIHKDIVDNILKGDSLKTNGLFILEHSKKDSFKTHPNYVKERNYGGVVFSFFKLDV